MDGGMDRKNKMNGMHYNHSFHGLRKFLALIAFVAGDPLPPGPCVSPPVSRKGD